MINAKKGMQCMESKVVSLKMPYTGKIRKKIHEWHLILYHVNSHFPPFYSI